MHFSYLREFIEIVFCRNFSEAARKLNTAQSTLSKHVLALEKECGAELLVRSSAHVRLTPEGRILFEEATDIIEAHDRALRRIADLKQCPPIMVGGLYLNTHILGFISSITAQQKKLGKPLSLRYSDDHRRSFVDLVRDGSLDVAFTMLDHETPLPKGVEVLHLFDDPLVSIMADDHPLARKDAIALADFDQRKMLSPAGSYSIAGAELARALFARHGVQPIYNSVFLESIHEFPTLDIADNLLILEQSIQKQQPLTDAYRVLPFVDEDACFPFYALYRTGTRPESLARFLTALEEEARLFQER